MTHMEEIETNHARHLPHAAAIAAALGGGVCSLLDTRPGQGRKSYYDSRHFISLPGELFALQLRTPYNDKERFTASLIVPREFRDAESVYPTGFSWPAMSWRRSAADLAGDIRRRAIAPGKPLAVQLVARRIFGERQAAEKAAYVEQLGRQIGHPITYHNYSHGTWTAPGFRISDYDLDKAAAGGPVHCEITVPLHAFPLIARILAACPRPVRDE